MKADRVVLDSNVLISALLSPSGAPRRVIGRLADACATLLFADPTFVELAGRLAMPKFDRYRSVEEMEAWLDWLIDLSEWVYSWDEIDACRDPDDNKFLAIALAGETDVLITGDDDLLVLNPFEGLPVVSPADFLRGDPS